MVQRLGRSAFFFFLPWVDVERLSLRGCDVGGDDGDRRGEGGRRRVVGSVRVVPDT